MNIRTLMAQARDLIPTVYNGGVNLYHGTFDGDYREVPAEENYRWIELLSGELIKVGDKYKGRYVKRLSRFDDTRVEVEFGKDSSTLIKYERLAAVHRW